MKVQFFRGEYTSQDMFETLSMKVGVLAVFLGAMVFFNLYMLFRGKKKTALNKLRKEHLAAAQTQRK